LSDTDSRSRSSCAGKLVKLVLAAAVALAGYAAFAYSKAQATAPLQFPPFKYELGEKTMISAKWEFRELAGDLTGGASEVKLGERELNALLFGEAGQTNENKARVLIQGDALRVEASAPKEGGGSWNVVATLKPTLGPDTSTVELRDAQVGDYAVDPVSRWLLARRFEDKLREARANDPRRLGRVKALWVEGGQVRLVYDTPAPR
jgi:hypothetical protein